MVCVTETPDGLIDVRLGVRFPCEVQIVETTDNVCRGKCVLDGDEEGIDPQ